MSQCLKETTVRIYLYKDNYEKIKIQNIVQVLRWLCKLPFIAGRSWINFWKFPLWSSTSLLYLQILSNLFLSFLFPPVKNPFPLLKKKLKKNSSRYWTLLPAFTQEGEHNLLNHVTKEMTWLCQNLLKHYLVILLLGGEITFTKTVRSVSEPTEVLLQETDSHKNNL